jgi:hypothetical protein
MNPKHMAPGTVEEVLEEAVSRFTELVMNDDTLTGIVYALTEAMLGRGLAEEDSDHEDAQYWATVTLIYSKVGNIALSRLFHLYIPNKEE